MEPGL